MGGINTTKPDKALTRTQERIVEAILDPQHPTIFAVAAYVGVTPQSVYNALASLHVQEELDRRRNEIKSLGTFSKERLKESAIILQKCLSKLDVTNEENVQKASLASKVFLDILVKTNELGLDVNDNTEVTNDEKNDLIHDLILLGVPTSLARHYVETGETSLPIDNNTEDTVIDVEVIDNESTP